MKSELFYSLNKLTISRLQSDTDFRLLHKIPCPMLYSTDGLGDLSRGCVGTILSGIRYQ